MSLSKEAKYSQEEKHYIVTPNEEKSALHCHSQLSNQYTAWSLYILHCLCLPLSELILKKWSLNLQGDFNIATVLFIFTTKTKITKALVQLFS